MPPVPRKELDYCFQTKLSGQVPRDKEHTHYTFKVGSTVVASTHLSPEKKIPEIGDDLLSRIAGQLGVKSGTLRRSAKCDSKATQEILDHFRLEAALRSGSQS